MAIWQQQFFLTLHEQRIDSAVDLNPLRVAFNSLLPRRTSWSPNIEQWGEIDSTVVEILHADADGFIEISVRVDARTDWVVFLVSLWERLSLTEFAISQTETGPGFDDLDSLIQATKKSRAVAFARNPRGELKRYEP